MKIIFIEEITKNGELIKTSYFTLNLEENINLEIFNYDFFIKKLNNLKNELLKKINELLENEDYSLTENIKKYTIFESLLKDYIENLEEEIIIKNENKNFDFKSVIIDHNKILSFLSPQEINEIILRSLKEKKSYLVKISKELGSKGYSIKVEEIKEEKKGKNKNN